MIELPSIVVIAAWLVVIYVGLRLLPYALLALAVAAAVVIQGITALVTGGWWR